MQSSPCRGWHGDSRIWHLRGRSLHVAGGGKHGLWRVDFGHQMPAPAGVLLVERLLGGEGAERGDIDRLEELMVFLAHESFATIEDVKFHVLHGYGHLDGIN